MTLPVPLLLYMLLPLPSPCSCSVSFFKSLLKGQLFWKLCHLPQQVTVSLPQQPDITVCIYLIHLCFCITNSRYLLCVRHQTRVGRHREDSDTILSLWSPHLMPNWILLFLLNYLSHQLRDMPFVSPIPWKQVVQIQIKQSSFPKGVYSLSRELTWIKIMMTQKTVVSDIKWSSVWIQRFITGFFILLKVSTCSWEYLLMTFRVKHENTFYLALDSKPTE